MKYVILLNLTWFSLFQLKAQSNEQKNISFGFYFGKNLLVLDSTISEALSQTQFRIHTLKFYVSSLEFYKNDSLVWKESAEYHLVDASDEKSMSIKLSKPEKIKHSKIKFILGVDSLTNMAGVMSGALDPTKGMYWTWQSGYINFKLEGISWLNNNPKKEFQFHLGGYKKPYETAKQIVVETSENFLIFDTKVFFEQINLNKLSHLMMPSYEAFQLSEKLELCFRNNKK